MLTKILLGRNTRMNIAFQLKIIFLFSCLNVLRAQDHYESLVQYYVNIINNHTQKGMNYEFPTDARMYEATPTEPVEYGEFDFIIVGAGTAGCIIANRLSEIKDWNILLLEAGVYKDEDLSGIPQMWISEMLSKFNWGTQSVPQKYGCQGNPNKSCFAPHGKGVGGGSLINGMAITRGNKYDYERWSQTLDDPTWNYENVLPYFKKYENFTQRDPDVPIDQNYHGSNGLLHVTQAFPPDSTSPNFLRGAQQLGYDITDYNGKQQLGFSVFQLNMKHGRRHDVATAFISTAKSRSNLKILDKSYVTKINISPTSKEVLGVTFTRENKTYIARNLKEVILSAGAISSPQLLMLSGIGPKSHLSSVGIPVIQDLPVGKTMRDHTHTPLIFSSNITNQEESLDKSVEDFLKGKGELTRPFIYDAVGWINTLVNKTYPDVELLYLNLSKATNFQRFIGYSDTTYEAMNVDVPNEISIIVSHLDTKSIGSIKLKSSDPFEYPLIDPNILSDNDDVEAIYRALQIVTNLTKTEVYRSINASIVSDRFSLCNHIEPLSKEYWKCYIKMATGIASHQTGTCLTGKSPQTGVVDKRLKVFGIEGLRVADGSVIPYPVAGHTNAVCAMVGEKASDIIKQDYDININN